MSTQVTINDIIPRTQLISSGGQTVFNTNWTANVASDVVVYARANGVAANDVTQIVSTMDYNVTFIGDSQTVRVTFTVGRTALDIITIVRDTPADRLNLYTQTNFTPLMLNEDVGILTLVDQQAQMFDEQISLRYNKSATVVPIVDTIIPVLGANQIWAKNNADTAIIAYDVPASGGVAPKTATYLIKTATSELPNAQVMGDLATGIVVNTTGTGVQLTRTIAGTSNQVNVANGTGLAGDPTLSLSSTLNAPGTLTVQGTTAVDAIINDATMATATATNLSTSAAIKSYVDGLDAGNVKSVTGTANRITSTGGVNPVIDISASYVGQASITTLGTIATGTWQGTVIGSTYGGTGINNGASTITLGGSLSTVGAFTAAFTMTGNTAVTFPTSGTLATVGGTVASITGTANQITASSPTGAVTLAIASNAVLPGTGGLTLPTGTTAQQAGIAGTIRFNSQTSVFESTDDGVTWNTFSSGGGSVLSVTGTANQVEVDNTNPNTPIVLLPAVIDVPGTFNIQASTAVDEIINDNSMATATATNLATALSIKTYVDAIASGFNLINPVRVATTAALTGTYANGAAGVGATFTITAVGAASIDSVSLALNDRVLIKDQASTLQNGVYYVSTVGDGGTSAVYTRATDFDTPAEIEPGDLVPVLAGTINQYSLWLQTATVTAVGTDPITFVRFGDTSSISAGTQNALGYYAAAGNTISPITTANSAVLVTNASGAPAYTASLTDGQLIIGDTSGTPTPATLTAGTGISITNGAGTITVTNTGGVGGIELSMLLMGG